jgi:hypothetical protein
MAFSFVLIIVGSTMEQLFDGTFTNYCTINHLHPSDSPFRASDLCNTPKNMRLVCMAYVFMVLWNIVTNYEKC